MVATLQKRIESSKTTIQALLDEGFSYGKIGKSYDLNRGIIHRFMNDGYIPESNEIRQKLGLELGDEIIISIRKRDPITGRLLKG